MKATKKIVEISSGKVPPSFGNFEDIAQDITTVDKIISKYSPHPSVQKIRRELSPDKEFIFPYANHKDQKPDYQVT